MNLLGFFQDEKVGRTVVSNFEKPSTGSQFVVTGGRH